MDDRSTSGPPQSPRMQSPASRAPTSDSLRTAVDQGQTRDKVPFPDPAAAPLGTDDEAAGTPPTPEQRRIAARHELSRDPDAMISAPQDGKGRRLGLVLLALLVVVLAVVLVAARPG